MLPAVLKLVGDAYAGAPMRRSKAIESVSGVVHGFSGRSGGWALPVLDLGVRPTGVAREQAWEAALTGVDVELDLGQIVLLDQVHGATVLVDPVPAGHAATVGPADAVVSTRPGVVLAVRTADCVPVLMTAPGGVAAVHAGWRGIVAGIVPAAVAALCSATGADPASVVAAVGPHASVEAYETGRGVVDALVATGLSEARVCRQGPREVHTNLRAAVEDQLRLSGVAHIDQVPGCTMTDPELHSYRRDGVVSGRQAALIARVQ
jgi:hypothetical protein